MSALAGDFDAWENASTDYPIDYDRDRYDGDYFYTESARYEAEQEREEAYALAEAEQATGEADIAPGIHVVRTTGGETGEWHDDGDDRFDDDEYDEYDALIDGRPRW